MMTKKTLFALLLASLFLLCLALTACGGETVTTTPAETEGYVTPADTEADIAPTTTIAATVVTTVMTTPETTPETLE